MSVSGHNGLAGVPGLLTAHPGRVQTLAEVDGVLEPRPLEVKHQQDLLTLAEPVAGRTIELVEEFHQSPFF